MTSIVIAILAAASAQDEAELPPVRWPALPATATTAAGFAPRGWAVQLTRSGDLNGDGRADLVAVLQQRSAEHIVRENGFSFPLDTNPRLLLVALASADGRFYRLALQNRTLIPRHTETRIEDPFGPEHGELAIRRGAFTVTMGLFANMGTWTSYDRTFTFRLTDGRALLIGLDDNRLQRNSGETIRTSINYLTRVKEVSTAFVDSDDPPTVRRTRTPPAPLQTIEQVGNGMEITVE